MGAWGEALYRRAVAMKEKLLGASHPETALTVHNYASMRADLGRTDESRALAGQARAVFEAGLDPRHPWRVAACGAVS
jgi:hypothetical protein